MAESLLMKADSNHEFSILKSDDLVIGGYASIEIVDKQNDLITLKALDEAVQKYMKETKYRNVMSNHSNVQVGEVVEKYRDSNGILHKTGVDDVGFYVVIKLRDDIEKAKEISRGIRKGTLRSFSIGGQAISKKQKTNDEYGEYNEIEKLELHEVTICEKGINPEAKFDILKQDVGGNKMSEKLEKALEELNDLMKQVNSSIVEKTEDNTTDATLETKGDMEYMDSDKEMMDTDDKDMDDDDMDMEEKALDEDSTRDYEAGEEVVSGGTPKATPAGLDVVKGLEDSDFSTLNLSAENVEKAYEAFKAERMEKIAYDSLSKQFETRLAEELEVKKASAEAAAYDARSDVIALKEEFAELRKSLTAQNDEIVKSQSVEIPSDVSNLSWNEIADIARKYN
mgnify:CR=1 FL=1|tara:strand:+ start:176 stop:1366 length:1191 start_codon:yes stop_codon:yes gene_type:complete